jgi:hypothetical protein
VRLVTICNGLSPVLAKGLWRNFYTRRRLPSFVFVSVDHTNDVVDNIPGQARFDKLLRRSIFFNVAFEDSIE